MLPEPLAPPLPPSSSDSSFYLGGVAADFSVSKDLLVKLAGEFCYIMTSSDLSFSASFLLASTSEVRSFFSALLILIITFENSSFHFLAQIQNGLFLS